MNDIIYAKCFVAKTLLILRTNIKVKYNQIMKDVYSARTKLIKTTKCSTK